MAVGFASMCVQKVAYRWSIELDSWLQALASPHKLWRAEPSLTPPPLLPGECETATQSPWMRPGASLVSSQYLGVRAGLAPAQAGNRKGLPLLFEKMRKN